MLVNSRGMNEVNKLLNSLILVGDRDLLVGEIEAVKRTVFSVGSSEELEASLRESLSEPRAREFFTYLNKNKKSAYCMLAHVDHDSLSYEAIKSLRTNSKNQAITLMLIRDFHLAQ